MYRFASPEILHYLWFLPFVYVLGLIFFRAQRKKSEKRFGERISPVLVASVSWKRRKVKLFFLCLSLAFLIVAAARPQLGGSKEEIKNEGVEIMLVVDVSDSMMAEDIKPNRLVQAKTDMSRLIDLLPGNKIGVVAFAGSATLLAPLSTDPGALNLYLDSLATNVVSTQGTQFIPALETAKEAFERGGVGTDEVTKVTRVIVIASDGENHEEGALEEAQKLSKEGIRIFTIAYGTEKGAPIPVRDRLGFLTGYKKDEARNTVLTTVKGDALRAIAKAGDGSFYHSTFDGNHLKNLAEDIGVLEKTQFNSEIAMQYEEKFQIFVALGILFLMFSMLLGERKKSYGLWKGRFEVVLAALLLPQAVITNNQGVDALAKTLPAEAQSKFVETLQWAPVEAAVHLNLGLAFAAQGQPEKAQQSYLTAAKLAQDPKVKFMALFNLGELAQKAKKKNEALYYYQEALNLNPASKETKINIELLTQNQQGGGGSGENQEQDQNKDQKDGDQKDEKKQDKKDQDKDGDQKKDKPPKYGQGKQQPQKFKSGELSQDDVNKILGEIKQQEQKIRAEFNKTDRQESPNGKDW